MKKRQILKALSLLAAVCIAAGCNGNTAAETTNAVDITATTTAEITTTSAEVTAETEAGQGEFEEINGKKYCKIPEGMTFEDLCGLVYYKDTQLHFPCTIDEILALNENWKTDKNYGVDGDKSSAIIYEVDEDGNEQPCFIVGTYSEGSLDSFADVSTRFVFMPYDYAFNSGLSLFVEINGYNKVLKISDFLGRPSYEESGYQCYDFKNGDRRLKLDFGYDESNTKDVSLAIWTEESK